MSRLKRASFRLVFKANIKIIDIAFEARFESAEAFSRAFKREFGQSPSEFRRSPKWLNWYEKINMLFIQSTKKTDSTMDVKIIDFKEQKVATLAHYGDPKLHYQTSMKFIAWRKETKLSPIKTSNTYGIPYSDPNVVKAEDFHFDLCGAIKADIPENEYGVVNQFIPAGRCAVVRDIGNRDDLAKGVYYLYQQWLPTSGEHCRDFPVFFHYVNFVHDVPEHEVITDIYLPIK
ncbi:AraC family transcriptional regulator [Psychromonas sp. KJ10-10]|uniref:AraC family transcriptional regulator n=1 Tax=Psychromonas sp. KJ10-10 TaxID=3391823 RepID=UPI0039B5AB61